MELKNLPSVNKELPIVNNESSAQTGDSQLKSLPSINNNFSGRSSGNQYDLDISKYTNYIDTVYPNEDVNEQRAQSQGRFAKLGSGLVNTLTGTALDIVGDVGYLLDTENYTNFKKSSEEGFNNWLSDWTNKTKQDVKLDIYRTKDSEGFSPLSAGWWGDNLPSIASTVSMMIPAEGAVMGLSKVAELLGGAKLIKGIEAITGAKELSGALKGITGAVISRHMESLMEGGQVYQETYAKALEATGNEKRLKKLLVKLHLIITN